MPLFHLSVSPRRLWHLLILVTLVLTGCDGLFGDLGDHVYQVSCDEGQQLCHGQCIPADQLCCDSGEKVCADQCIPDGELCCDIDGDPFGGGDGESTNPYRICSQTQLENIVTTEAYDASFRLHDDIFLDGTFTPIAGIEPDDLQEEPSADSEELVLVNHNDTPFQGSFDGNGHQINGLVTSLSASEGVGVGLFGHLGEQGHIFNLNLAFVHIEALFLGGGLVGYNEGTISDVMVSGEVTMFEDFGLPLGGLVGVNAEGGLITDCTVDVETTGTSFIGGLAGVNYGEIIDSTSAGMTTANIMERSDQSIPDLPENPALANAGGLVGINDGVISRSGSSSAVLVTGLLEQTEDSLVAAAGLAGINESNGRISESFATGALTIDLELSILGDALGFLGGLAGSNSGTISNTYANVDIAVPGAGFDSVNIGGLVGIQVSRGGGEDASTSNSYATGHIDTSVLSDLNINSAYGGLIGERSISSVTASYWDRATSALDESDGGQPLETDEFSDPANFSGWDFRDEDGIWVIGEDANDIPRPVLQWENR